MESAETVIPVLKMQRASWFYGVFALFSGIPNFLSDFAWFPQKTHLKTYAVANDLHNNYQTATNGTQKVWKLIIST